MICSACGAWIDDVTQTFCDQCGTSVDAADDPWGAVPSAAER